MANNLSELERKEITKRLRERLGASRRRLRTVRQYETQHSLRGRIGAYKVALRLLGAQVNEEMKHATQ